MPRQKIVTLYEYDELPTDAAKEEARDWYRRASAGDETYSEWVFEDFVIITQALGIDLGQARRETRPAIYYSGFWSQGDGASFAGTFAPKSDAGAAIREHAPEDETLHAIGDAISDLFKKYPDLAGEVRQGEYGGRYVHETTMDFSADEYFDDDDNPHDYAAINEEVTEIMRDLARWLYRTLESAYDSENSDENVTETIRINEYTFTEDGKRED